MNSSNVAIFEDIEEDVEAGEVKSRPKGCWPRLKWLYKGYLKRIMPILLLILYTLLGNACILRTNKGQNCSVV